MDSGQRRMIQFDEASHTYRCDGRIVPNVTTIMDPLTDFSGIRPDVLEHKKQIGTAVHLATELFDQDCLDFASLDPVIVPYVEGWIKFRDEVNPDIHEIESRLVSKRFWYAGTTDRIVQLDNRAIIDIKTVAKLEQHIGVQLAAYKQCVAEDMEIRGEDRVRIDRYAVQLKPDGTYNFQPYRDRMDFTVFQSCLNIYNWRN